MSALAAIVIQSLAAYGAPTQLAHRYSFTSDASDSIGGANGTLPKGGTFNGGQLAFSSATQQYLSLPGGILSGYTAATIDMWATIQTGTPTFCYLFCIGDTDASSAGYDYVFLNPNLARITISAADPGYNGEQGGDFGTLAGANHMHITSVFDCPNGVLSVYTNGVLAGSFNGITDPLSVVGTQFAYIGRSLYNDSFFNWSIDELRIYNGALSALQVEASDTGGPSQTNLGVGTVTNLQLEAGANQLSLGVSEPSTVMAQTTVFPNPAVVTPLCTFSSGNSNILRVDTNGVITAFGLGSAAITASYLNATSPPLTITVVPALTAQLLHRYSFTANANDSIGTADGTLGGTAAISNGAVVLDGVSGCVNLPSGLISSLADVSFEAWVTPSEANGWGRVFDFGSNTGGAGGQGQGLTYAFLTTAAGGGGPLRFALTLNGNGGESPVLNGPTINNNQAYCFAVVYSPSANTSALYVNGLLAASGGAPSPLSGVADVNDWLGKSQFNDPYFGGSIDEFRIWGGALTPAQVAADYTNGPNMVALLPPTNAVVINLPAYPTANAAALNGEVVSTGNQTPAVTIYYGLSDGGANAGAWGHSVALGAQTGLFSTLVTGLATNTTYYYTSAAANSAGTAWAAPSLSFTTLSSNAAAARIPVLTYHYDNTRQGLNTNETMLTLANVNAGAFGKLFSYPLDGYTYTEPLIMTNVAIPGEGTHDVVFVATEHDTVYALDANGNTGTNGGVLWTNNLGAYALSTSGAFGYRYTGGGYTDILPDVGITGTPVIDPVSGTLFVDAFASDGASYKHRLHALDVTTGRERSNSPVVVTGSVPGTGVDSSGGVLTFNPVQEIQRAALTLANGIVYVGYAGYGDTDPYHGWLMGYYASNLAPAANSVFCSTPNATQAAFGPNADEGGIWMGGRGLCVDSSNNLYFETGNGSFSQITNGGDYADSFIKLSTTNGLKVADYFTPYNQLNLAGADLDLAACGPMLVPPEAAGTASLIVGTGKAGTIYLLNRDNMGHFNNGASDSQIVQSVAGQLAAIWSSPVYFNHLIFCQSSSSTLKTFTLSNGVLGTAPASQSTVSVGQFNGGPVISANGTNNGIAWLLNSAAFGSSGPAVLYAFNATNLSQMLYNSGQNLARDNPGGAIKMTTPTVAGGKVYVGAQYSLSVYGVQTFLNTPVIAPDGGPFTNSVQISMTDGSPGASIYYTLDGSAPTAASLPYTGPFVLASNALVQAIALETGAIASGVASASFVNTAAAGSGTGLLGQYYSNALPSNPFVGTSLARTDAVVNFNWSTNAPFPGMAKTNYTVRWTGSIQPQFSETYTFSTTASDGARLFVNGQELINDWTDQAAITESASLPLQAQQLYNIEMDYYQHNSSNPQAALAWSSPSTPRGVAPQTQLYPFTNPPPSVQLTAPSNNASYSGTASVTMSAAAAAPYNQISAVSFYANGIYLGSVTNLPYTLTATRIGTGNYALTAVSVDGSGLASTSAPVNITVAPGGGADYGLTASGTETPFLNMPTVFAGTLPVLLSQTGVFSNTPNMTPTGGLIPFVPNTPLWSDGALKTRYMGVPNNGGVITPDQQISFAPTGAWSFPAGTIFVKTFSLNTDTGDPNAIRRLETRLLVRDTNGQVYGVTYKWRPDNSDADLLTNSLSENILITNGSAVAAQTWYYPSPSDCLACHTAAANYVLGVNTRQLNGNETYSATGITDNQLRTLNRLGLFNPAINEGSISNFEKLSALTNVAAPLQERSRSYLDANCAQCHQPGGTGITFDARYDTPLANQNIVNFPAAVSLGYDHARIVAPRDLWRSALYDRVNTVDGTNSIKIQMPPLARNVIDTNAVAVLAAWINSLPGTPALGPPVIAPNGGNFIGSVSVSLQPPDTNATLYYTLDGSLPTTNSPRYAGAILLTNGAMTLSASAFEANYVNSVAASALFVVQPLYFASEGFTNGAFRFQFAGTAGSNYVLEATTNFTTWVPLSTNMAVSNAFNLIDTNAANFPYRFYRIIQK
ncbi:MAG TPA: LamG-like jellyroll fold domain-containing protein [Verrucomicrobiae bacterium]|jgi:hypothetical protein